MKIKRILEVGDFVTLEPKISDNSWSDRIWKVLAFNKTHVQLTSTRENDYVDKILIRAKNYAIHDASSFVK